MLLQEAGVLQKMKEKWFPKTEECGPSRASAHQINLKDVYVSYFLLGAGILTACVVLCLEVCVSKTLKTLKKSKK